MSAGLDATHDASLMSWVSSANHPATDFPIQNLPLGIFRRNGGVAAAAIGVAIGDRILDLAACARAELLTGDASPAARYVTDDALNRLMAQGRSLSRALRSAVSALLHESNKGIAKRADELTLAQKDADVLLPARIGDYTDFYASIHHATNVGGMFRPDNPLLPNYKFVPIGYHGRASSIVVSGAPVQRPCGQTRENANAPPAFGASRRLDYEVEVGAFIGVGNPLGHPVPLSRVDEHLWGICLVNDWSARDIQSWEYQPLGPFLAKNFATTISPWVVTLDALAPFRTAAAPRAAGDPEPLPYLAHAADQQRGSIDLTVEVWLRSARMREQDAAPVLVSRGSFTDMYWTLGQMLTHHTSNGCNLRPGDLIASGTISGPGKESRGCLLERTWKGTEPIELPTGERRGFLEDGDEVIMRGHAQREGYRRIGLGVCAGVVETAPRPR